MNASNAQAVILNALQDFGSSLVFILGAFLVIALGVLIVRVGWGWLHDKSYSIGGYYLHNLPYKGYKRWRSKQWNAEHMP